jgi:hypothetical protein
VRPHTRSPGRVLGQLAYAMSIARGSYAAPAQNPAVPELVAGIDDVAGVEAGGSQHCAWTTRGEVWCWGWVDTERYEPPRRVAGLHDAVEVSGGEFDRMMPPSSTMRPRSRPAPMAACARCVTTAT